jgi:hypothetical protein
MRLLSFQLVLFCFSVLAFFFAGSRADLTGGEICSGLARFLLRPGGGGDGGSGVTRFLLRAGGGGGGGGGGAGAGAGAGSGLFFLVAGPSCALAFRFLPLTLAATTTGRACVAALGVLAMSNVSAFTLTPPFGGGGGGLLEDDAATSRGAGAGPWMVVPRRSIATSRFVMPAISCDRL